MKLHKKSVGKEEEKRLFIWGKRVPMGQTWEWGRQRNCWEKEKKEYSQAGVKSQYFYCSVEKSRLFVILKCIQSHILVIDQKNVWETSLKRFLAVWPELSALEVRLELTEVMISSVDSVIHWNRMLSYQKINHSNHNMQYNHKTKETIEVAVLILEDIPYVSLKQRDHWRGGWNLCWRESHHFCTKWQSHHELQGQEKEKNTYGQEDYLPSEETFLLVLVLLFPVSSSRSWKRRRRRMR